MMQNVIRPNETFRLFEKRVSYFKDSCLRLYILTNVFHLDSSHAVVMYSIYHHTFAAY